MLLLLLLLGAMPISAARILPHSSVPCILLLSLILLCLSLPGTSALSAPSAPHLCKCTCFLTNTTILPLISPLDPHNPCATCTRQFCLDQGLEGCKGAKVGNDSLDTASGWEGDVWAKCFQRDSSKDRTIVTLYLLCILSLLLSAVLRSDIEHWLTEYRTGGLHTAFRAVQGSAVRWVKKLARIRRGVEDVRTRGRGRGRGRYSGASTMSDDGGSGNGSRGGGGGGGSGGRRS